MSAIHTSKLRAALERHAAISESKLGKRHPHAASWFAKRGIKPGDNERAGIDVEKEILKAANAVKKTLIKEIEAAKK